MLWLCKPLSFTIFQSSRGKLDLVLQLGPSKDVNRDIQGIRMCPDTTFYPSPLARWLEFRVATGVAWFYSHSGVDLDLSRMSRSHSNGRKLSPKTRLM